MKQTLLSPDTDYESLNKSATRSRETVNNEAAELQINPICCHQNLNIKFSSNPNSNGNNSGARTFNNETLTDDCFCMATINDKQARKNIDNHNNNKFNDKARNCEDDFKIAEEDNMDADIDNEFQDDENDAVFDVDLENESQFNNHLSTGCHSEQTLKPYLNSNYLPTNHNHNQNQSDNKNCSCRASTPIDHQTNEFCQKNALLLLSKRETKVVNGRTKNDNHCTDDDYNGKNDYIGGDNNQNNNTNIDNNHNNIANSKHNQDCNNNNNNNEKLKVYKTQTEIQKMKKPNRMTNRTFVIINEKDFEQGMASSSSSSSSSPSSSSSSSSTASSSPSSSLPSSPTTTTSSLRPTESRTSAMTVVERIANQSDNKISLQTMSTFDDDRHHHPSRRHHLPHHHHSQQTKEPIKHDSDCREPYRIAETNHSIIKHGNKQINNQNQSSLKTNLPQSNDLKQMYKESSKPEVNDKNVCNQANQHHLIKPTPVTFSMYIDPPEDDTVTQTSIPTGAEYYGGGVRKQESFHDRLSRVLRNKFSFHPRHSIPEQRFSILGRPLPVSSRISFFTEKVTVYNFLQRPRSWFAYFYHVFLGFMIVSALVLFALTTVPSMKHWPFTILRYLDLFIFQFLLVEYLVLLWSASCVLKYQNLTGKIRFVVSPFRILDLVVIISSAIVLWLHWNAPNREQHIKLGWLRSLQIVQILRLENRFRAWRLLSSVIWLQRKHLLIISYMAFLILIVISYVVYFFEQHDPNTPFKTIPTSLWWGIVSVMTIGYGDVVPVTSEGKIIGGILSVAGAIIYAIPAGIIATGLALKVQENNRQKHLNKRTIPAAKLIQRAWRCYAASKESRSEATWKHTIDFINDCSNHKKRTKKVSEWSIGEKSFDSKFTSNSRPSFGRLNIMDENDENVSQYSVPNSQADLYRSHYFMLSDVQKNAILFLRKIRFAMSLREFKNALKPYDIQDVLQQYSEGHADVIYRVRSIQSRVNYVHHGMNTLSKVFNDINQAQLKRMNSFENKVDSLIRLLEIQNQKLASIELLQQQQQQAQLQHTHDAVLNPIQNFKNPSTDVINYTNTPAYPYPSIFQSPKSDSNGHQCLNSLSSNRSTSNSSLLLQRRHSFSR